MHLPPPPGPADLPSIERLLQSAQGRDLADRFGRDAVVAALRDVVGRARHGLKSGKRPAVDAGSLLDQASDHLQEAVRPRLRPVFNLTGTVLHTNLGRAPLPAEAIAAVAAVAAGASNLEYDLDAGARGDRDSAVADWLCRLTGAEAAAVVNNNAAALLLVVNSLALRKEVLVSRGELVEIGDSFRIPDLMQRSGARLKEVGTTNRTRLSDYAEALGPKTALIMRVHPSNYRIEGFSGAAEDRELAELARSRGLPFVVDLGSGSLVDLKPYGLPHEPTPREAIAAGADLVTFSGDKLLGGPQAGLIVGRQDLIARIRRNPLRRALRCDKMTIAALGAVLPLHGAPDLLGRRLPTLALLTRPSVDIEALADALCSPLKTALSGFATVERIACLSQIGSGALPVDLLPSAGLRLSPLARPDGSRLSEKRIAAVLRHLPQPVIGRIERGAVILDLRCLTDTAAFREQLALLPGLLEASAGDSL